MQLTPTLLIIALTCLISFSAFSNEKLMNEWIFHPPAIDRRRQWYRFITSGFLHGDFMHLAFNMFSLWSFGRLWEQIHLRMLGYSSLVFYAFYLLAIVASDLPSYLKNRNNSSYYSLGASGAVSAVIFSTLLYIPWAPLQVFFIPMPAILFGVAYLAISFYLDKRGGGNINHSAHLFGALFGLAGAVALNPNVVSVFLEQLRHPSF